MRNRPGIDLAGASDLGCQRENNEDNYSYWEPDEDGQFREKGRLLLVADGMGGHRGGQEASRIAVEIIQRAYAAAPDGNIVLALDQAFQVAHQRIQECAAEEPMLEGMGTTCTAALLRGHDLYYAHVGDSRLYLVRDEGISRLTHDHSFVGRLIEQGVLSPQEAEGHPQRHVLTAALGAGPEISPEVPGEPVLLASGDVLVLCTDGLWGLVSDGEIGLIASENSPQEACRLFIQLARERGGPDNITVQVLRVA